MTEMTEEEQEVLKHAAEDLAAFAERFDDIALHSDKVEQSLKTMAKRIKDASTWVDAWRLGGQWFE